MYRIQKLLANFGYCSRRRAEELIRQGRVRLNGSVASIGDKASPEDKIYVDGRLIKKQEKLYLMFNKPLGCVTALRDKKFRTIMDYIKVKQRVFPIGRLDYNTSGLLLLTNDGDFANKVMHPRFEINKTYLVKIDKDISSKALCLIKSGVELEDGKTSPAAIKKHSSRFLEITIHEGKKRIVRRIFEQLGYKVQSLKRIRIGSLGLGDLKPGRYRLLTDKDKRRIFEEA